MPTASPRSSRGKPVARQPQPDAHGQAALLLAESILHTLVAREVLSTGEAIVTVRVAAEVKADVALDTGESKGRMRQSLALLDAIGASLAVDGKDGPDGFDGEDEVGLGSDGEDRAREARKALSSAPRSHNK